MTRNVLYIYSMENELLDYTQKEASKAYYLKRIFLICKYLNVIFLQMQSFKLTFMA